MALKNLKSILLLFGVSLLLSFQGAMANQKRKVTLEAKGISLETLFKEIKKQTDFIVFYNNDLLNDQEKIDVSFKDVPLEEVMKTLLNNKSLSYRFADSYIIISKENPTSAASGPAQRLQNTNLRQDSIQTISGVVRTSSDR